MRYSPFDIGYDAFYRRHSYYENNTGVGFATANVSQNNSAEVKPAERPRVMDLAFLVSSNTRCGTEISRCETPSFNVQSGNGGSPDPPTSTDNSSILTSANSRGNDTEEVTCALDTQKNIGENVTRKNYELSSSGFLHGVPVIIKTTYNPGRDGLRSAKRQAPKKLLLASRNSTARPDFESSEEDFEKIERVSSQGTIIYACPLCSIENATKESFQEHMKSHWVEGTFECHLCPRKFKIEQSLHKHIIWHSKISLECHICHKVLSSIPGYKMHMESHSGITYECTICNRELLTIRSFEGHMKTHIEDKVYECSICQKKLKYKSTLKAHLRRHTGEKPYECTICHTKKATSQMLRNHMKKHL